jgi:TolA-binding protein
MNHYHQIYKDNLCFYTSKDYKHALMTYKSYLALYPNKSFYFITKHN